MEPKVGTGEHRLNPLGVIVAGGRSVRMGTDKAFVDVGGRPMIEWVGRALDDVCAGVVIAGRAGSFGPWTAVPDLPGRGRGPLAGVAAVAAAHPDRTLLVVGVDQPWVRPETLRGLAGAGDRAPVVPVDGGFRQPLCALYPAGLASLAIDELAAGGSLQSLLDVTSYEAAVDWHQWGEDGRSWFSADDPDRLADGLARFGPPV